MTKLVEGAFEILAVLFDKVPVLNKLKGYRSILGFIGMGTVIVLKAKGIGNPTTLDALNIGFMAYTGLALNAKGRSE